MPAQEERALLTGVRRLLRAAEQTGAAARSCLDRLCTSPPSRSKIDDRTDAIASRADAGREEMIAKSRTSGEISQECCDVLSVYEADLCAHVAILRDVRGAVRVGLQTLDAAAAAAEGVTPRGGESQSHT